MDQLAEVDRELDAGPARQNSSRLRWGDPHPCPPGVMIIYRHPARPLRPFSLVVLVLIPPDFHHLA
eukprot:4896412-Pyramimonas_sp.AAC.1